MRRVQVLLISAALAAGCFPIELDVAKDGRILIARQEGFFAVDTKTGQATRLYAPKDGKPVFARFSPDASQILAVTEGAGGMMGSSYTFSVVALADDAAKAIFTGTSGTYATWSPDGQRIALTRVAQDKVAPLDESLPELHVVTVASGEKKQLSPNVSLLVRWFPDSKAVLSFRIDRKDTEDNLYRGGLVSLDVVSGESKTLAAVAGTKDVFFDLSPDGKTILFTARGAAAAGQDPKPESEERLFTLDVAGGAIRAVREKVNYALWSPDGKRVLVAGDEEDGALSLYVAEAEMKTFQKITADAAAKASGGMGGDTSIYPAWVGNDAVAYLTQTAVYGTAGKNLALIVVGADGKNRRNLQPVIDAAALKSAE